LIILLTITLLLFGAKRIPQLARSLRVGSREFRKGISGTYDEQTTEGDEPRKEETSPKDGAPVAARSSETEHVLWGHKGSVQKSTTDPHERTRRPKDGEPFRKLADGCAVLRPAKADQTILEVPYLSKGRGWPMFGVGAQELVVIGLLLLVVFGPDKLTGVAHELGRFVSEARRSVDEFKAELTSEDDPHRQRGLEPGVTRPLERDGQ
jgi:TatA/E family protein of Tat protein translocase